MLFRQLMLTVGFVFVATAGLANAKAAPEYLQTNSLDNFPQLQLEDESSRAMCPLTGVSPSHRSYSNRGNSNQSDVTQLDVTHLYDWAHPDETLAARQRCAMPAPLPDIYENIG